MKNDSDNQASGENSSKKGKSAKRNKRTKRANGEGTLVKRFAADGTTVIGWKAAVTLGYKPDGTADRRWVSGKTQDEVRLKSEALKAARNAGEIPDTDGATVESFGQFWLENKPKVIRAITKVSYAQILKDHVYPTLGNIKLDKLNAATLDKRYREMVKSGLSTRVVRYTHTIISMMLKQAVKWSKLPRNVADAATPPSLETRKMQVWTPKDALQFLACASQDRLQAAWYLGLFAGLRRAEILGLRWQDLDLETADLNVNQGMVLVKPLGQKSYYEFNPPKTASSVRSISLSIDTVVILKDHLKRQQLERGLCGDAWCETGLVFTSSIGTPIDPGNLARCYKKLIRLAGVPNIRLHELRHTMASLAIRRGDSPKVVSERMGHSNVAFTLNTYVKTYGEQRRDAALGIGDLSPRDHQPES